MGIVRRALWSYVHIISEKGCIHRHIVHNTIIYTWKTNFMIDACPVILQVICALISSIFIAMPETCLRSSKLLSLLTLTSSPSYVVVEPLVYTSSFWFLSGRMRLNRLPIVPAWHLCKAASIHTHHPTRTQNSQANSHPNAVLYDV